jgi:hypothetical protein
MRRSGFLSTFESASFDPKAVRQRELVRTWLAVIGVLLTLLMVGAFVLSEGLGGDLFYKR